MGDWLHMWCIAADIYRADTHVYWGATSVADWRDAGRRRTHLFDRRVCSLEMFKDLIRRSVVSEVSKKTDENGEFFSEDVWEDIERLVEGTDEVEEARWRVDPEYDVTVQAVGNDAVRFNVQLWGYKYDWGSVELPAACFYELTDRLDAGVRFQTEWSPVDQPVAQLRFTLKNSRCLQLMRPQLEPFLDRLRREYASDLESLSAESLRLLEKLLRKVRKQVGWSRKKRTASGLDPLIKELRDRIHLPQDQEDLLWIVAKPYRDYAAHGNDLPSVMARPVLGWSSLDPVDTGRLGSRL